MTSTDYGKDEDSAQAMLKKHNAVMSDLEAYGTVVDQLRDQSKTCKVRLRVRGDGSYCGDDESRAGEAGDSDNYGNNGIKYSYDSYPLFLDHNSSERLQRQRMC